jgi:hypothetical protein
MVINNNLTISDQPGLNELITLSEAADLSGLSPNHLRLLVSKGVIWGKKLGRNWFTTTPAVKEYLKRDRKPGPKPQKRD